MERRFSGNFGYLQNVIENNFQRYKRKQIVIEQKFFIITIVVIVFTVLGCNNRSTYLEKDFSQYFENINSQGCIIIYDNNNKEYTVYNKQQSETGILPASTFKIYNSLISLETGVALDESFQIEWDGTDYQFKAWNQTHTLESAIEHSVVWYYQELARRIGKERMQKSLDKLDYGNKNIDAGIDIFWLKGDMEISAKEQIELLKKLYFLQLPFTDKAQSIVKNIIILEKNKDYKLSGKTGTVMRIGDIYYSWFVGYVELNENIYFFATNLKKNKSNFSGTYGEAKIITIDILKSLNIL